MANLEVIALDTATPQLKAPQAGDGYAMPRPVTVTEVVGSSALTLTGATQTADTPVLNATQTWNNAAVTFTGLKFNATDTASNAASLLMDLRTNGVSLFSVDKTGKVQVPTINGQTTLNIGESTTGFGNYSGNGIDIATGGVNRVRMRAGDFRLRSDTAFGFAVGDPNTTGLDVSLYRDAADTLAQRRTTNSQTFRVYNTYTDASNYERVALKWVSNVATIAIENAGTGGNRGITLQGKGEAIVESTLAGVTFRTSSANRWYVTVSGPFVAAVDNTHDIGASGASRPRIGYFGTRVDAPTLRTDTAYTVATLPAAGTAGRRAYVTDALAPTFLGAMTGGGAVICPVFDNGTAWVAG